ncbi:hypothetical protein BC828DRAFT_385403 [Blastocladiella britannica]|nr:hypothetical protein BC828DRAFT_385403 [Blastocladiella britannica]
MEVVVTTKRPATTNTMKPMPIRPVVAPVPIPAAVGNPYSAGSPLSVSQPPSSSPAVPTPIIDTSNMDPEEARKANYRAFLERKAAGPAGPSNPGSKVIPVGQPNCLHGLTFVLSGDFESLARNEMEDLIKRYNGRVTGSVSGKTSYLVRGDNAGMSKTKKAEQLGTKVITEDDVLDLIGKSAGKSDAQVDATKSAAVTKRDAALAKIDERVAAAHPAALWTDKYRPTKCSEIIGNKANVDRLLQWLRGFAKARTTKFRFEGEKSLAHYRAALLSGPPGVGKTTSAHVAAREAGLNVIEFNASDMRSKKSLDEIAAHLLHNQTLFGGKSGDDHVVIMDEVDGMSTSDRGGLAELTKLIAKSRVPVICICNDRSNPKLKTLAAKCLDLPYRRPEAQMVRSRLMTICHREGLKVPPTAIDALHASTRADIRQMITLLSSYRLSHTAMDYDDAKRHGADQEKDMSVGMFEATRVLLSPADVRRSSLNQLMEQYFVDFDMVPLMVQENYVKVRAAHDPIEALARLSAAADAIAVSDHVSAMIRGQQQWGLLPTHAVFSAAVPAHAMCSGATCSGSSGMYVFTSALGNMSRTAKFGRILAGVDQRIGRLSHGAGAGRAGARLDYIPAMSEILHSRWKQGGTGTAQLIETMDAYYLGREDLDDVLALRVGRRSGDVLLKEIPGTAKAAFTREYNKTSHPAFEVGVPASKRAAAMGLGSGGGGPDYDDGGEPDVDGYEAPAGTGDDQDNAEEEKDDENEEALRAALAKQAKAGSGAKSRGKGKGPASATTTAAHKSRSK